MSTLLSPLYRDTILATAVTILNDDVHLMTIQSGLMGHNQDTLALSHIKVAGASNPDES